MLVMKRGILFALLYLSRGDWETLGEGADGG